MMLSANAAAVDPAAQEPVAHIPDTLIPDAAALAAAARRIRPWVVETPLLESPALNTRLGGRVLFKAEPLQRTGSFKMRGAANKLLALKERGALRAVVAYSSGNHAQAVAAAAALAGVPAVIVMPKDAPALKREATAALGAEIVLYDRDRDSREAIAEDLAAARGAALVPPFGDAEIIAGQASCGLEIAAQCEALGVTPEAVLAPSSGGGLIAGLALALGARYPGIAVHPVEPEGFDDLGRSLASGRRVRNAQTSGSLCDSLMAPTPGALDFTINMGRLAPGLAVSDDEALTAMALAFRHLKLVVEPGGAVPLAALLAGKLDCTGRTIVCVLSGGNVEAELFARALSHSP